jgi:hypothetical protein
MVAGKPKGLPTSGGARVGSIKTHTKQVKAAVLRVFEEVNQGDQYLRALALDDQRLFLSLLARLIPQEVAATVDVRHSVDLGAAMAEAQQRVDSMHDPTPIIEHNPSAELAPTAGPEARDRNGLRACWRYR